MIITTTPAIPNGTVTQTHSAIFVEESAMSSVRARGFSGFDFRRIFSPPGESTERQISELRAQVIKTLTVAAEKVGANAIVGLQLSYVNTDIGLCLAGVGTPQTVEFAAKA